MQIIRTEDDEVQVADKKSKEIVKSIRVKMDDCFRGISLRKTRRRENDGVLSTAFCYNGEWRRRISRINVISSLVWPPNSRQPPFNVDRERT